jgi:tRNA-specific 2-thiouridylase
VSFDHEDADGLYQTEMEVTGLSFTGDPLAEATEVLARPRYRDPAVPVRYSPLRLDEAGLPQVARITFASPQRALAAGQVVAFYAGEQLLGGAFYR